MPTRELLENYSEEELVLLLKCILMKSRDRFDSVVSLQYYYEIMIILICKLKGYSTANTVSANKEVDGFLNLARLRNSMSHDLVRLDSFKGLIFDVLESHIIERLAVVFIGSTSLVSDLLDDLAYIANNGYKSLLDSIVVDSVRLDGIDVLVSELVKDLPDSVRSKYNSDYMCLCDNIGRMI